MFLPLERLTATALEVRSNSIMAQWYSSLSSAYPILYPEDPASNLAVVLPNLYGELAVFTPVVKLLLMPRSMEFKSAGEALNPGTPQPLTVFWVCSFPIAVRIESVTRTTVELVTTIPARVLAIVRAFVHHRFVVPSVILSVVGSCAVGTTPAASNEARPPGCDFCPTSCHAALEACRSASALSFT